MADINNTNPDQPKNQPGEPRKPDDTPRMISISAELFEDCCNRLHHLGAGYQAVISAVDPSRYHSARYYNEDKEGIHALLTVLTRDLDTTVAALKQ